MESGFMKEHEYERDKSFFTLRNIGIAQDISKEAVSDYAYADAEHTEKVSVTGSDFTLVKINT